MKAKKETIDELHRRLKAAGFKKITNYKRDFAFNKRIIDNYVRRIGFYPAPNENTRIEFKNGGWLIIKWYSPSCRYWIHSSRGCVGMGRYDIYGIGRNMKLKEKYIFNFIKLFYDWNSYLV